MVQLIDKSAVVAEIKRISCENPMDNSWYVDTEELLDFLNTLEVKDVDLEEKATQLSQKYFPDEENIWARPNIEAQRCKSACIEMVEWFKAQKGE